jgi:hypothetical protein
VRLTEVEPNPTQPRKVFENEPLEALAESIAQHGIIQPIVVRPKDGMYMIVTGERRWRAARMAGLSEVPVIIIEADDRKAAELASFKDGDRLLDLFCGVGSVGLSMKNIAKNELSADISLIGIATSMSFLAFILL